MNMFGNLGKMAEMMKQAKAIKDAMSKIKVEGEAGGVKVTVNGEMSILEISIPSGTDAAKAAGSIKEAANKALRSAQMEAAKRMQGMGGFPGM